MACILCWLLGVLSVPTSAVDCPKRLVLEMSMLCVEWDVHSRNHLLYIGSHYAAWWPTHNDVNNLFTIVTLNHIRSTPENRMLKAKAMQTSSSTPTQMQSNYNTVRM